jgi:hypothetical protein
MHQQCDMHSGVSHIVLLRIYTVRLLELSLDGVEARFGLHTAAASSALDGRNGWMAGTDNGLARDCEIIEGSCAAVPNGSDSQFAATWTDQAYGGV